MLYVVGDAVLIPITTFTSLPPAMADLGGIVEELWVL